MSPLAKISSMYQPRFAEFAFEPGFTAAVDQHVAEIRDRLSANHPGLIPPPPHREALTDYALGFLDALDEMDWREPVGHDYAVCRLTAISWLARRHDLLTETDPGTGPLTGTDTTTGTGPLTGTDTATGTGPLSGADTATGSGRDAGTGTDATSIGDEGGGRRSIADDIADDIL
ncbi:DUF6401 family natural product biosynthesis protein [Streptomyces sp. NPDC005925]|uniref:DUF6401 family natural product biosynthesis protein n=1 Tax=Streptomyces sp. NPDC005925 TaxID=3157172 RepID=UPI0033F81D05